MSGVKPGESTDRWSARAAADYHAALDGLGVERRCIMITGITAGDHPVVDEGYDGARTADPADRKRADPDHRMTDEPSADPQRRPVYDDFSDGNNNIDWARFREAATAWDTAQAPPGSVQDPFNNLPAAE